MPDVKYAKVSLEKLFDNKRGNSDYTKKYCSQRRGEYEVYTGSTKSSFSKVDFYDYNVDNLSYTTDGEYAGTLDVLRGKYSVGGHRAILTPKVKGLDLDFFKYILQPLFRDVVKKGSVPSLTWTLIKEIEVSVPIMNNGEYDVEEQKKVASKLKRIEKKKERLITSRDKLLTTVVEGDFTSKYIFKEIAITDLFIPTNGSGKYVKKYCNEHKGKYPVYSGSKTNCFAYVDSYDYSGKYLTWCIDGLAGYLMLLEGKFSITNHRGILLPKYSCEDVDLEYMKYTLEPIFRKNIKGRVGHNGQNEYTSLKLNAVNKIVDKISIPIRDDGTFDLDAQREIAMKYKKIDSIRNNISKMILEVTDKKIDVNC